MVIMADMKEKYEGTWNNKSVKFTRSFSGYRFSDAECEALCNGDTITVNAVSAKTGNKFSCNGKLQEQSFTNPEGKEVKYVGFKASFDESVPKKWCEHIFTDDERTLLEMGKEVYIEGFVSKKGNVFSAKVKYDIREDGTKGIIPLFE